MRLNQRRLKITTLAVLATLICINVAIAIAGAATYAALNRRLNELESARHPPVFATPPATAPGDTVAAAWLALDGDYDSEIGFKQELLTLQDSGFLATGTANFVDMTVLGQGETYLLHCVAAQGEQLKPGRYAVSVANRTGPSLGASISGLNGSCESEIGNFEVFDISMSRAGTANVVFVRFELHCGGIGSAVRGELYFGAGQQTSVPAPPPLPRLTSSTVFNAQGEAGDNLIGATSYSDDAADARIQVGGGALGVMAEVTAPGQDFRLTFLPPIHKTLAPGTYTPAFDSATRGAAAGLEITAGSTGCNHTTGSFEIVQMTYGPDGALANLDIKFVQHCEGAGPATQGELRVVRSWK